MSEATAIRSVVVTLGAREYAVCEAGFARSRRWRKRFVDEIKPLFEQVSGMAGLEFGSPADLLKLLPLLDTVMVDGIDRVFELLLAYSDTLSADREYIEESATDRQILDAFREVASIAFPFDLGSLLRRQLGRAANGMSSNLPVQSGG